jgi:hypothetical protein
LQEVTLAAGANGVSGLHRCRCAVAEPPVGRGGAEATPTAVRPWSPPHWRSLVWAKGGHDPPCLCKFSTGNMLYLLKFNGLDLKKIPTMCKLEFWRPTNRLSCTQVSSAHRQQSSMHPACSSSLLDSSSLPLQPGNSFSFDHAMMSAVIFFDNNMLIY